MRLLGTVSLLALAILVAPACTSDEAPQGTSNTEPSEQTPTPSATDEATEAEPALVFGDQSAASIKNHCGDRSPAYVTTSQTVEVTREVRLGKATVSGGGRLVGPVSIAPTRPGPDAGMVIAGDKPGYHRSITGLDGWRRRTPVPGTRVQPGRHIVFAQVRIGPGRPFAGLDFAWFGGDDVRSTPFELSVKVVQTCGNR